MSIQNFTRDHVVYINNGDILYNGRSRTRWEGRCETDDGASTFTDAHFLAPERATRSDVVRAYCDYISREH